VTWTAGAFVLVRLYAVLLLPGIILARLVALALDYRAINSAAIATERRDS